jgi:hypothetical protein
MLRHPVECERHSFGNSGFVRYSGRAVKGLLIDGPCAGQAVDAGDPPVRRAVVVRGADGFGELAYRYYLESVDFDQATYRCAGEVEWPPEASSVIVRRLSDHREWLVDATAAGARLKGT